MAKDVKIRQIQHDIKVLDKAAMEMSHVKNVALKTKDTLNDISSPQQETPEEYASDKMTNTAERAVEEGVYGTKKQVNRIQKRVQKKEKLIRGKRRIRMRRSI